MVPDPSKTVLLVDLSALFRAAWHANENGPTTIAMQTTLDAVRRCQTLAGDDVLTAVCCDGRGNWRKALAPEYKAHREKQPEAMYGLLDRIKARLVDDGYLLWTADGYEADDVIATACAKATAQGHEVVIASHDKDVTQLLTNHVRMLRTSTWEMVTPVDVFKKFGVEPEAMGDLLALMGDKTDGVAGIPSVGQVTAAKLLIQHGDIDGIYKKINALKVHEGKDGHPQCETMTDAAKAIATPAIVDKLWRHEKDARMARALVTLKTDAPITYEDLYTERRPTVKPIDTTNMDAQGDIFAREKIGGTDDVEEANAERPKATVDPVESSPASTAESAAPVVSSSATVASSATGPTDTAMVPHVAAEVEYEHALEPKSPTAAITLGQVLYESRAFQRFPTAGAITATVMRGRELGISALASLDAFHFVAELGRILPSWQVIVSLAEQSPDCEWFRWVEGDEKSQTWATKHRKHPVETRMTYKIEQADRAGLIKPDKPKSAWMARPDEMLRKTCACQLARAVYPGATLGLYAVDEMGGES